MVTYAAMDALTINQAAETTGWSARMLRYIEQIGLVEAERSKSGYRLYGPAQLQRLRTLRELLDAHQLGLGDVGFARRLQTEPALKQAVDGWLADTAQRPPNVEPTNWLAFEQAKHQRLLEQV